MTTTTARVIDGKQVAAEVVASLAARIAALPRPPGLAVVLVGDDPASAVYVRHKTRMAERLGFAHWQFTHPADYSEVELLAEVRRLNADPTVDGILVQFPVPKHIDRLKVLDTIDPAKDVDGLHVVSAGLLSQKRPGFVSCTPAGVMELLARTGVTLRGAEALVIGRSDLVGRPVARLLEHADCTVTVAHSRTRNLAEHVGRAEILIAAVGVPEMVKGAWVRPGSVVIDVGVNRQPDGKLVGDVEFGPAAERAAWITPVPGGVGPMTIAMLMSNTVLSSERRFGLA
ncbi:MAG: bifunctional methylenetetrahydrofolate dehydrogenase/methenyltetrahydrofolate cyclohydrolase FolD [Pseudomonadota bacterium]|nr:bifunctional methylenetetrahydrofolate dehydrogenase/methenyltetrahydrofolate cyclohydrolase FolD [Pseudomonadota bacterium]